MKELIRDCVNKLDKLSDDSWEDIIDRYNLNLSPHELRKRSYGMKMALNSISNDDEQTTEQLLLIKKEKQKLSDLRTEANKSIRNLARIETMIELLKNEIKSLPPSLTYEIKSHNEKSGKDAILCIGDIHDYLYISNNVNQYNHEICKSRFNEVIDRAIEYGKLHNIDKLHIVGLGDYVSGTIHNSLKISNQEEITQQIVGVSDLISNGIKRLSDYFYCTVSMVNGNHDSCEMNKSDRHNNNNYTKLIREFVKLRIANLSNVVFLDNTINNNEVAFLNIKNLNVAICHGDKIQRFKAKQQLEMVCKKSLDLIIYGHVHNPQVYTIYDTTCIVNGCLCGSDSYAMDKKLYSEACQVMAIVNDREVECIYKITC